MIALVFGNIKVSWDGRIANGAWVKCSKLELTKLPAECFGHIYFSTLILGPTGRRSGPRKISKLFQN
jgi:hypothetical protein